MFSKSRSHKREQNIVQHRPIVSPEEAAAYPYSEMQRAKLESMRRRAIVGTAEQVREQLTQLATRHGFDELVVVTWTYDPAPRHRSYELLAQAFGLSASA